MIIDLIKPVDAAALDAVLAAIDDLTFRVEALETTVGGFNGRITANETNIGTLQTDVGTLQTDVGTLQTDVGSNTTAIGVNTGAIAQNTTDIGTNAGNIATNATDIGTLQTDVGTNTTDIGTNAAAILVNSGLIADNTTAIGVNASAIAATNLVVGSNTTAIGVNAADILTNAGLIASNTTAIGINAGDIAQNTTDIGINAAAIALLDTASGNQAAAIAQNAADILTNSGLISTNISAIAALVLDVGTNTSDIAAHALLIAQNTTDIGTNSGLIAGNTTAIGVNAGNIAQNTIDIGSNTTAIGVNAGAIASNTTAIGTNSGLIAGNTTAIGVNAADILTNAGLIAGNTAAIGANAGDIATLQTDVGNNTTDIGTNATNIASNDADILALQGQVATNITNISNNTTNIATNVTNIATNAADILANAAAIAAIDVTADVSVLTQLHVDTNEPTGFIDRAESTIAFDNISRTFTITPTAISYITYIEGVRADISAVENIIISNDQGMHFIYADITGALHETLVFDVDLLFRANVYVAAIYWDPVNQEAIYFGDERHGTVMDWATHAHFHTALGAQYINGFGLFNMIVDGSGDIDTHAQVAVDGGLFRDEDLDHTIVNGAPQTLSPIAGIPIIHRLGANGDFSILPATNFLVTPTGTGRAAWNEWTGTTWQLSEVGNNDYVLAHVYATNCQINPIVSIMGTNTYNSQNAARIGANNEIGQVGELPFEELVPLATVIFRTANNMLNAVKSAIVSTDNGDNYVDWRTVQINPTVALGDHNILAGRADADAHPTSAITGLDAALALLQPIRGVTTTAVNTLMSVLDYAIFVDATLGNIDITLPTAVGNDGIVLVIKKTDGTANEVNVIPDGIETIDNLLTGILTGYNSVSIISDGANWHII